MLRALPLFIALASNLTASLHVCAQDNNLFTPPAVIFRGSNDVSSMSGPSFDQFSHPFMSYNTWGAPLLASASNFPPSIFGGGYLPRYGWGGNSYGYGSGFGYAGGFGNLGNFNNFSNFGNFGGVPGMFGGWNRPLYGVPFANPHASPFGIAGFGGFPGYGGFGGYGGWGMGGASMFSPFGSNDELGITRPPAVIQTAPSKASGNYYQPSTIDSTASGSYYASTSPAQSPSTPSAPSHRQTNWGSNGSFWGSSGSPFPKDLNSVPWNK